MKEYVENMKKYRNVGLGRSELGIFPSPEAYIGGPKPQEK